MARFTPPVEQALYELLAELHDHNGTKRHTKGSFCRECIVAYEAIGTALEKAEAL